MAEIQKRLVELPPEVSKTFETLELGLRNSYIAALREIGWTLTSISNACGLTRERVRQLVEQEQKIATAADITTLPLPEPPIKEERAGRVFIEPSPETLARLLELQPKAQLVRSNVMTYRKEAEEYTRLLNHAHTVEGVTLYRLAKRLGVTHPALRFRLARYGYKTSPNGQSKVYQPIRSEHRLT